MKIVVVLIVGLFTLSGCSKDEVRDVSWYEENVDVMNAKVDECGNDSEMSSSVNCKNAIKAKQKVLLKKWKNG
ncbi:EexN family lipoprotein [Enterovibrio sp. ZSDZ42]|uniref:EexN family lipoprotein n=1 Tax=Enterovibrio gelatinilyticus TaxID=2899819 RepID=A0ABT5RAC6_9GAMM|nr:EexN family lipoprotein [Enterovibrio sp. ZSDZ42]MDD1796467.1 EexN family lipoprotein [Enterovibrio sp. ZSDZ42]